MSFATRIILVLMLMLVIAGGVFAQEATAAVGTQPTPLAETSTVIETATSAPPSPDQTRQQLRERFSVLLGQHPKEVTRILALDPTLLSNEPFLARYPELTQFLAENPEVRRNPHYYLREFAVQPERPRSPFADAVEGLSIASVFFLVAFALAWFVRTVIEQKRWNRLSRTQAEVHSKILDRFGTSEELLQYIGTPAGAKFLESAPIPLHTERPTHNPPLTRAMWSIQIGVVVGAAAFGMLLVTGRFPQETAQELFAMGVIGLCIGAGFVASAAISIFLSRRYGLWQPPQTSESLSADHIDRPGLVR